MARKADERVGGHTAARDPALARSAIAPYAQPAPIEIPIPTSLPMTQVDARTLYEDVYCGRGELENRI
jgi:hypothetical protein